MSAQARCENLKSLSLWERAWVRELVFGCGPAALDDILHAYWNIEKMPFSDIVGQEAPIGRIRRALAVGRTPHAYLFTGPEGVGKMTTALALAKALNCIGRGSDQTYGDDFCDNCVACKKIERGGHPDVSIIEPAESKVIKIDRVRELQRGFQYGAFEGRSRVAMIDGAEQMNISSANALLKTLEEPPAGAMVVLVTTALDRLLPTIVSRCQTLRFGSIPQAEIRDFLTARDGIERKRASLAAALSNGSLGRALQFEERPEFFEEIRPRWLRQIAEVTQTDTAGLFALARELAKDRERLADFFDFTLLFLRDAMMIRETGSDRLVGNVDLLDEVKELAGSCKTYAILSAARAVEETAEAVKANANRNLALETMMLSLRRDLGGRTNSFAIYRNG